MNIIHKHYYKTHIPELQQINGWSVFVKFNLSDDIHLYYVEVSEKIVAYAFVTRHQGVPILNGGTRVNFNWLLDYIEVKHEFRGNGFPQKILKKIFEDIGEPIVLETMPDTTDYFYKLGARYIREPVTNAINVMVMNVKDLNVLDKRAKKFYKYNVRA